MKSLRTTFVFSALLAVCVWTSNNAGAQTSSKAIFTDYSPYLCVGGNFVAMSSNHRLIVIPIDVNGIEAPQTIPSEGFGLRCSASHIEQVHNDVKSGRFIVLLYTVQWHSQSRSTIQEEQAEEIPLPKSAVLPAAIVHMKDSFWQGNRAGLYARGDWYVGVPRVVDRPNNIYEVHFISVHARDSDELVVDLLEETLDKKVTQSVPLVHIEGAHD
jgi:hypothetical protein